MQFYLRIRPHKSKLHKTLLSFYPLKRGEKALLPPTCDPNPATHLEAGFKVAPDLVFQVLFLEDLRVSDGYVGLTHESPLPFAKGAVVGSSLDFKEGRGEGGRKETGKGRRKEGGAEKWRGWRLEKESKGGEEEEGLC